MTAHMNFHAATDVRPVTGGTSTTGAAAPTSGRPPAPRRTARWMLPAGLAIGAVFVGSSVLLIDAVNEPSPRTFTDHGVSQRLIDESIADAIRVRSLPVESPATGSPQAPVAEFDVAQPATGSSQRLVQDSIDQALADNAGGSRPVTVPSAVVAAERWAPATGSSQRLVQDSIDQALADNAGGSRPVTVPSAVVAAERWAPATGSSQRLVQDSIDQALAAASNRS